MSSVINTGDKVHIMTRRLFEDDVRRHFIGEITVTSETLVEVRGYTFIFQDGVNEYRRLPEERFRLFSLGDSGHVVNKIPKGVDVSSVVYDTVHNRLVVTDRREFTLPINEFGPSR